MENMSYLSYLNDTLARFEEVLWHELGGVATAKVEMIGVGFIQSKKIEGDTVEKVLDNCIKEIIAAGIAKDITYVTGGSGIFLKLNVKGCVHLPVEAQVKKDGIQPYMCPIVNMVFDRLIEILGYETAFLADLDIDQNKEQCIAKCAIYETAEKIGQVSDWTKL